MKKGLLVRSVIAFSGLIGGAMMGLVSLWYVGTGSGLMVAGIFSLIYSALGGLYILETFAPRKEEMMSRNTDVVQDESDANNKSIRLIEDKECFKCGVELQRLGISDVLKCPECGREMLSAEWNENDAVIQGNKEDG